MRRRAQLLLICLGSGLGVLAQEPPADAPSDAPSAAPVPAAAAPADRREAIQAQFLRLIDDKRYSEAIVLATQVLGLTTQLYGETSIELATPLSNLATAQMHNGDLTAAESNYQAAIALIEKHEGILSTHLVNPLIGLGATYHRAGLYSQAMEAYQRALRVNHAEQGFNNLDQLKIRDGLTEAYLGMDRMEDANFQQQTQLAIHHRKFGRNSPELVPAIEKLARWYDRTGQYPEAQLQWSSAKRLLRETGGPQDPAIADVLIGEAKSYENQALLPLAIGALQDALEIIDAQPSRDFRKRAEVLVALGDLNLAYGKSKSAREQYVEAWKDLSGSDELLAERDGYFARPRRVAGRRLHRVAGGEDRNANSRPVPDSLLPGFVVVTLAVDQDGRVSNPKVIESEPPGLMDEHVLSVLASSRFRPRMSEGAVVASPDAVFRHDFRYARAFAATRGSDNGVDAGSKGKPIAYPESVPSEAAKQEPKHD
jgi:tetratricopeptide (TPR) repeat protein